MAKKEGNIIEILSELKVTVRAIRETGSEILKIHTEMIQERVNELEENIKLVG